MEHKSLTPQHSAFCTVFCCLSFELFTLNTFRLKVFKNFAVNGFTLYDHNALSTLEVKSSAMFVISCVLDSPVCVILLQISPALHLCTLVDAGTFS